MFSVTDSLGDFWFLPGISSCCFFSCFIPLQQNLLVLVSAEEQKISQVNTIIFVPTTYSNLLSSYQRSILGHEMFIFQAPFWDLLFNLKNSMMIKYIK